MSIDFGLLERMERLHLHTLRKTLGRPATYRTGRKNAVPVTVIPLETGYDRLSFDGVPPLSPQSKVFLIGTDDVPEPKIDDVIELDGQQWTITPVDNSLPWSVDHGQCNVARQVHTRR